MGRRSLRQRIVLLSDTLGLGLGMPAPGIHPIKGSVMSQDSWVGWLGWLLIAKSTSRRMRGNDWVRWPLIMAFLAVGVGYVPTQQGYCRIRWFVCITMFCVIISSGL